MRERGKILCALAIIAIGWLMFALGFHVHKTFFKPQTIVKIDSIPYYKPIPVNHYYSDTELVAIPVVVPAKGKDTIIRDTIRTTITLKREYATYQDTNYRAVISGVQPRLDTMIVFKHTISNIVKEKSRPKPWGISVQGGYGYNGQKFTPYVGIGISYSIIRW